MKPFLLAAALLAAAVPAAAAPKKGAVVYRLEPVMRAGQLTALSVDIRFNADADGETRLGLPDHWASEKELWTRVRGLKIEGGTSVREDGPQGRIIVSKPGAPIHVRYQLVSGYDTDPEATGGNPFRPVVRPTWFEFHGETVFATPDGDQDRPARFSWGGFPKGWQMASDLEHGTMGRPLSVGDIQESIALGGADVTVDTRQVAGATLRVAMRGKWLFSNAEFIDLTDRIIGAQRDFWKDIEEPYLVTLMPLAGGEGGFTSVGGSGRTDAFALYSTTNVEGARLRWVLSHENVHTWIPRRIGGMPPKDEETDYWLSEGFTDFYSYRLLLRSGVWSLEDFTAFLNETLDAYAQSPVREAPNSLIVSDFWKNQPSEKLPYQRGLLMGFIWDARLRERTGGKADLDDVMLAMRDLWLRGRAANSEPMLASRLLPAAYAWKSGGLGLAPDISRYLIQGQGILLPAGLFGDCAVIETVTRPRFDRGWDPEATTKADNIVTGLKDGSPAYKAGLRNGMKIIKRAFGEPGDATQEYGLRVLIDGQEQIIRFMPVGEGTVTTQRVTLAPGMSAEKRAACTARMSGS